MLLVLIHSETLDDKSVLFSAMYVCLQYLNLNKYKQFLEYVRFFRCYRQWLDPPNGITLILTLRRLEELRSVSVSAFHTILHIHNAPPPYIVQIYIYYYMKQAFPNEMQFQDLDLDERLSSSNVLELQKQKCHGLSIGNLLYSDCTTGFQDRWQSVLFDNHAIINCETLCNLRILDPRLYKSSSSVLRYVQVSDKNLQWSLPSQNVNFRLKPTKRPYFKTKKRRLDK